MPFHDAIEKLQPIDDDGKVTVLIETLKGSRQKYDIDHDTGLFTWSLELPEGMAFPHSFGFVPNTLADDGDPLDILLLLDGEVPQGTVVKARIVGVLAVELDVTVIRPVVSQPSTLLRKEISWILFASSCPSSSRPWASFCKSESAFISGLTSF